MKRISISLAILLLISCSRNSPPEIKEEKNPFYDKAFEFRELGKTDSAFTYFNQAKDLFLLQKNSFGIGKCLVNMGIISTDNGDYFGGQEISLNAIKYLNKNDKKQYGSIHANYNNLGIASFNLKDYQNALKFYDLAIDFAKKIEDINLYLNNKAKVFQEIKNYKKALEIFDQILTKNSKNQKEYARVLTNIAKTKWLQNPKYNAAPDFLKSLQIRNKENDLLGINSSYANLADYYTVKLPDSALYYALKRYDVAKKLKSPTDRIEALQKLIPLSLNKDSKRYFEIYQKLADSIQNGRNTAKNQFALIRYETEKNKVDLLKSQADNAKKQNNILRLYIILVLLAAFLVFGYFFYKKRQKNLRQEKEIEVKKTELKYVKKIHDHVANKVYQVMNEIDNTPALNKEELADKLDVIYKISRDLSYEKEVSYEKSFAVAVSKMIYTYASAKVDIQIRGNDEDIWENVKDSTKSEVISILQELMTNMVKHSKAEAVTLDFDRRNQHINILYTDNGKGIATWAPKNGLSNTETRIKSIAGVITFENKPDEGLNIKFSFPIL